MLRLLLAAALAVLVAVAGLALVTLVDDGPDRLAMLISGVALAVALGAAALAIHTALGLRLLDAEFRRLVGSVDAALSNRPSRTAGPTPVAEPPRKPEPIHSIKAAPAVMAPVPRETTPRGAADAKQPPAEPVGAARGGNVVHLPDASARRRPSPPAEADTLHRELLAQATAEVELSLQPIVSIASGEACGFDVFRWIGTGGTGIDVRRIAEPPVGLSLAGFERQTVEAALRTGRRRLGTVDAPLHVAVSAAMLTSAADVERIADMLRLYPAMQRSVMLSFDAALLRVPSPSAEALATLADAGFGFALEADQQPFGSLLADPAIRFARLPVSRLISRGRPRKGRLAGLPLLEEANAAGIPVIAEDVASDEEAMLLLDLGVDLMSGTRFARPRRLKPEGGRPEAPPPA